MSRAITHLPVLVRFLPLLLVACAGPAASERAAAPPGRAAAPVPATVPAAAAAPSGAPAAAATPSGPSAAQRAEAERAAGLWKAGRLDEARLILSRLLLASPDFLEAQRDWVDLLLEQAPPAEVVAVLRDRLESGGRSAGALFGLAYAQARAGTPEGMRDARAQLDDARRLRPDLVLLTLTLAEVQAALDERSAAAATYQQAIAQLRAAGDWAQESRAYIRRAQLLHMQGDPAAEAAYQQAIQRAQEQGDRAQEALARNGLGGLFFTRGDVAAALASFEAALAAADAGSDLDGALAALQNLAVVHEELWQDKEALAQLRSLIDRLDKAGKTQQAAAARLRAGELLGRVGLIDDALASFGEAATTFQQENAWGSVGQVLQATGEALRANDRPQDALQVLEQALAVRRQLAALLDDHRPLAETLLVLGPLELEHKSGDGVQHLREALELSEKAGEQEMIARSARALARALLETGHVAEVPPLLVKIEAAGEHDPFIAAQLAAAAGQLDEALRLGEEALDPALALDADALLARYGLLLHLYLQRARPGDERRAFGVAVAGRAAHVADRLQRMRIRIEAGATAADLAELRRFSAQEQGMGRLISGAATADVERVWRDRLAALRRERAAWIARLAGERPAWAWLNFPEAVRRAAETLTGPEDELHLHPVLGGGVSVVFALRGKELQALPVQGTPDRGRLVELFARIAREQGKGARRVVLSPPPGSQAFGWGLALEPSPVNPVRPGPVPAAVAPAEPEVLELVTPLRALFETDRHGRRVVVQVTKEQAAKHPDEAVELVARALLYSGAAEVQFRIAGQAKPLVYSAN